MSTHDDLTRDLAQASPTTPDDLRRLHDRLAAAAQAEGILDVAYRTVDSPVGPLLLAATDAAWSAWPTPARTTTRSCRTSPTGSAPASCTPPPGSTPPRGNSTSTSPAPRAASTCRWTGGCRPDSARTVLHHLPDIGYGHTASYAAVAALAGNPKAVRAVGTACATNPLPVVVPCHRVVRSDGAHGRLPRRRRGQTHPAHLEARRTEPPTPA